MSLLDLPNDVLHLFVNKSTLRVCMRWYNIWCTKPLVVDLRNGIDTDLKKYSNVIGLRLDKYFDLNSYIFTATSVNLTNLRILHLNDNHIIDDDMLGTFTNLRTLTLYRNSVISEKSIEKLTNLTCLDLRFNDNITPDITFALPNLIKFGTKSFFQERKPYECLSRVKELSVGDNFPNEDLAQLTSLTKLRLFENFQIYNIIPSLRQLTNLTSLETIGCHLPGITRLESLKKTAPNLKEIIEIDNRYTPPLPDDRGPQGDYLPNDRGPRGDYLPNDRGPRGD
jgi:hypothetical protein